MINWGIIGAGSIARVFCNGLRFSTTGKALGVASRDGGRAAALAKAFGVSNWTVPRLLEAKEYAARNGLEYFSLVSDQFSLARMVDAWWAGGGGGNSYWASCSEPGFRTWFEETQMALVPWSSQASKALDLRLTGDERRWLDLER